MSKIFVFFDQNKIAKLFSEHPIKFKDIKGCYTETTGYYILNQYILLITDKIGCLMHNDKSLTESINDANQIIMIGDKTPTDSFIIKNYIPKVEFKILYHSMTSTESMSNLKKNKYCKGCQTESEENDTTYAKIAQYLQKDNIIIFDDIWKSIKDTDVILESKYKFMEDLCNEPENTDLPGELYDEYNDIYIKYKQDPVANNEILYDNMMKLMFGE